MIDRTGRPKVGGPVRVRRGKVPANFTGDDVQ